MSSVDALQNLFKNIVLEQVSTFPSGARKGRTLFHTGYSALYVCVLGVEDGANTALKGNWKGADSMSYEDLTAAGADPNLILKTNGAGSFDLSTVDGGTL